jgi:hypothetical protein
MSSLFNVTIYDIYLVLCAYLKGSQMAQKSARVSLYSYDQRCRKNVSFPILCQKYVSVLDQLLRLHIIESKKTVVLSIHWLERETE